MARQEAIAKENKYQDVDSWNKKGKLNEGAEIEGYYIDKDEFETKYGKMVIYIIEQLDGSLMKVIGQTDIKNKFDNIPMGSHIWITFAGLVETSRGAKKSYKVEYDPEDKKEIKQDAE